MTKTKRSTERAQYGRAAAAVREQAKYEREAARILGLPLAEVRQRIEEGRKTKAEQDQTKLSEQRERSIRFYVEQIGECLTDAHDMASALRAGDCGRMDPQTVAHGIYAVTERAAEFLSDLRGDLGITAPDAQ
jgi:hypothetical protein